MTELKMPDQAKIMEECAAAGRQPMCRYCKHPLDKIVQYQSEYISWTWNKSTKRYDKYEDSGDADPPQHSCGKCPCDASDWDFIDDDLVSF